VRQAEAGFTLVEVLVAFVASSILLLVLFDGMTVARERSRVAQDKAAALTLADRLLSAKLAGDAVAASGTEGSRLSWTVDEQVLARDPRGNLELKGVVVEVAGPNDHRLTRLEGRRLTRADQ
jgi:type II secretory pathway pseudopilin PulG